MEGQRLWSQELIQSISRTAYFYVCFASSKNCSQRRHRTRNHLTWKCDLWTREIWIQSSQKTVSNLHFSEVWVQSQKLIKSKVKKACFSQSNLLWSIDLNLMAQINSWHWPGLVCQLRTAYRIILSWRQQRVSPSVTSAVELKSFYQVGWAAEKEHFSFSFQTSLVSVPAIADTLII